MVPPGFQTSLYNSFCLLVGVTQSATSVCDSIHVPGSVPRQEPHLPRLAPGGQLLGFGQLPPPSLRGDAPVRRLGRRPADRTIPAETALPPRAAHDESSDETKNDRKRPELRHLQRTVEKGVTVTCLRYAWFYDSCDFYFLFLFHNNEAIRCGF